MSSEALTQLALQICAEQHRKKPFGVDARFHPYANLNHTIRLRTGRIFLRISDVMQDAPEWALRAIIKILLSKLDRQKVTADLASAYRAYAEGPEVRDRVRTMRRQRGRKIRVNGTGKFFNLQSAFDQLNAEYFDDKLEVAAITWSRKKTKRILGHYDRCHDVIVISRTLDADWVPPLLFHYILFHEMLHAHLGERYHNGRRCTHHPEFKRKEKNFHHYDKALSLMRQFSARVR